MFDNIRNKEVFGTSGPRIKPRFFGGWEFPADICNDPKLADKAYANGVAMGGDLPAQAADAPTFIATALRDPGTAAMPGTPLQRLQVIKGWYDADGNQQQRIYDVAGDANNGASVDLNSCAPQGQGHQQLCTVWRDPEFNADDSAVYYMRAVENPTCRYTTWQCLDLPADNRPAECDNDALPKTIQERAWSSPIWYAAGNQQ